MRLYDSLQITTCQRCICNIFLFWVIQYEYTSEWY